MINRQIKKIFCSFNTKIELQRFKSLYQRIKTQSKFSKLQIIAIQKRTFEAVVDFLNTLNV